ncbi:hypothetical protein, partial [Paraburkholderia sediminicola]|uniref:hypothetical protein n=1 Tax=Paraburkholderia sediminicola TaxID=458836 RepID=UPI0038B945C4
VTAFDKNAAPPKGEDVPVFEKAAAQEVAKTVGTIAGQIRQAREAVSKATKVKNDLIAFVDKAARKADSPEDKGSLQASATALRLMLKLVDRPFVEFNAYSITAGKALCDQIEESIKAHGEKQPVKEEKVAA